MRQLLIAGILCFVCTVNSNANAKTVKVSCDEIVQMTGDDLPCDQTPALEIDEERYKQIKQAYAEQNSDEHDLAPWQKSDAPAEKRSEGSDDCSMPIWLQKPGLKCD